MQRTGDCIQNNDASSRGVGWLLTLFTLQGIPNAVLISVMTPHQFVGGFEGNISGCMWHGQPLGCHFVVPRRNPRLHMQSGGAPEDLTYLTLPFNYSASSTSQDES